MALFGSKKNKDEAGEVKDSKKSFGAAKGAKEPKPKKAKAASSESKKDLLGKEPAHSVAHVLKRPHITEKASFVSETANIYIFEIDKAATKRDVVETVRFFYKADPIKVNIVRIPAKRVFVRGKRGIQAATKKAYVYFKKGEKIEIL